MGYKSFRESTQTLTFWGNFVISMLINFGINFGIAWANVSNWGKVKQADFLPLYLTRWTHVQQGGGTNNVLMDVLLTSFFLGFFLMFFVADGIQKDIREHKAEPIEPEVYDYWLIKYCTPTLVPNVWIRSFVAGLWLTVIAGLPTVAIWAIALGTTGSVGAVGYCCFKGFWAMLIAAPTFVVGFLNASHKYNFPALDFQAIVARRSAEEPVPVVAGIGKV